MKRGFWLISGIAIGLVAARRLSENPKAQAVVDDAARRAKEFGTAVAEGFKEREAEVSVRFVAELTSVVRNAAGEIVEGTPKEIKRQRDIWTFSRKMGASDPNWTLVATGD